MQSRTRDENEDAKRRSLLVAAQAIFPGRTSLYDETFEDLSWPTH
jgi:hypothetical protein